MISILLFYDLRVTGSSKRWAYVLMTLVICPKFLPGTGLEPVTFKWLMSLIGLVTNFDQLLLRQV